MRFLIIALVVSLFGSCKNKVANINTENHKTDTVFKDILYDKKGNPNYGYIFFRKFEKLLELEKLENGFDSIELRIWFAYSFLDTMQMVSLRNYKDTWSGLQYSIGFENIQSLDSTKVVYKQVQKITPKSGWEDFIRKLFELKILSLPDQNNLPQASMYADGNSLTVEYATKHVYRMYGYQLPYLGNEKIPEVVNIESIVDLVSHELDFKPKDELTKISNTRIVKK